MFAFVAIKTAFYVIKFISKNLFSMIFHDFLVIKVCDNCFIKESDVN